jgi:predicted DNA-binding transcriptional regulator AlpA
MADLIRSQVCERVGLTVRELLELVRDGRFPPARVAHGGSPPMWSEEDIAAWEQSAWTAGRSDGGRPV